MLRALVAILALSFSLVAGACWRAEGRLSVDGESWKFDQKIEHNKEYSIPLGTFILSFTVAPVKGGTNLLRYKVEEKKGLTRTMVTVGEDEIRDDSSREIYAKGEEGQPHSIINLKLSNI